MSRFSLDFWRRLLRSPAAVVGLALVVLIVTAAAAAGWLYPGDPRDMVGQPTLWPGARAEFPLGTDMLGRDMAAALMHGARQSLTIAFVAAVLALTLGILVGVICGYFGGAIDDALMRFTEIFLTMPTLLFAIAVVIILGPSQSSVAFALGMTAWPQIARLVRAEALRVRRHDYVGAAITMGMGHTGIILRHILPNSLVPVMVAASELIASVILAEAALSFLGLGDNQTMSWGSMIGEARQVLRTAWYMTAEPGLAIFLTVMAFTLLGNGLNDVLNPKSRTR